MSNCLVEASFQSAEAECSCVPGNLKISASQCHGPGLLCFRNVMNMIGEEIGEKNILVRSNYQKVGNKT